MIDAISAASAATTTQSTAGSDELGQDAFMKLLVTQLKNQDPLAPTDNQEFIAQLAQFSSLEEMEQLNDNIVGLAVLQQSNALMSQLTDSSALIGKTVVYDDPNGEGQLTGTVDSVKIQDGGAMLNIDGQDVPLVNVTEVTGAASSEGDGGEDADASDDGDSAGN